MAEVKASAGEWALQELDGEQVKSSHQKSIPNRILFKVFLKNDP